MTEKRLIELSKKLRQLKKENAEILKKNALNPQLKRSIIFPKFHYDKSNLFARTAPWNYGGFVVYLDSFILIVDPGAEFETRAFLSGINPVEAKQPIYFSCPR